MLLHACLSRDVITTAPWAEELQPVPARKQTPREPGHRQRDAVHLWRPGFGDERDAKRSPRRVLKWGSAARCVVFRHANSVSRNCDSLVTGKA